MPPEVALALFALGIVGLFWLDRERDAQVSQTLWIPTLWILLNASRPVSEWLAAAGLSIGSPVGSADIYLEGSPIDRNVYLALFAAGVFALVSRRHVVKDLLQSNKVILAFFGYCVLSILWSDYPYVALKRSTKGIGDLLMVLVVVTSPDVREAVKRLLMRLSFLLVPVSVLLIKYFPQLGQNYNRWTWIQEYVGVSTTKNMLGMICLICGLASAWRFAEAWSDRGQPGRQQRLVAHGTVLLMVIWLLSLAHSMTSLSCFLMASGLIGFCKTPFLRSRPSMIYLLITAMVGVTFFALFMDPGGSLVETLGKDPTLTGRTAIWNLVLELHTNPLLGTGYESFWLGSRLQHVWDVYPGIQEAHNGYLEVYLNLGCCGLALLLFIIVTSFQRTIRLFHDDTTWGPLAVAYCVVAVIYSFTEAGFRMLCPIWFMFVLFTVAAPLLEPEAATVDQTDEFAEHELEQVIVD